MLPDRIDAKVSVCLSRLNRRNELYENRQDYSLYLDEGYRLLFIPEQHIARGRDNLKFTRRVAGKSYSIYAFEMRAFLALFTTGVQIL